MNAGQKEWHTQRSAFLIQHRMAAPANRSTRKHVLYQKLQRAADRALDIQFLQSEGNKDIFLVEPLAPL